MSMFRYLFRKPKYPILIIIEESIRSARSEKGFIRVLEPLKLEENMKLRLIDSTGEEWELFTENMFINPSIFNKKRATKLQLIRMVNERKNNSENEKPYLDKSLSAKTFKKIFDDLVAIVAKSSV